MEKDAFDQRVAEIIARRDAVDDPQIRSDINFLLMWLASYKGKAEGYREAIDFLKEKL